MVATLHVAWATGRVNGHAILGRSVAQVEAVFGAPLSVERYPVRRDLRYRRFEVIFGDGRHASAFLVTGVAAPPAFRRELQALPGLRESRRYTLRRARLLRHVLHTQPPRARDLRPEPRPPLCGSTGLASTLKGPPGFEPGTKEL